MDAHTRRMVGWAMAAVGLVIAVVGGLADQLGLGGDSGGWDEFGPRSVAALVVGVVLIVAGLLLARLRTSRVDAAQGADNG